MGGGALRHDRRTLLGIHRSAQDLSRGKSLFGERGDCGARSWLIDSAKIAVILARGACNFRAIAP